MNRTKEGFDPTQKYYGHFPLCPEFDVRPSWCICDRLEQVMDAARANERERLTADVARKLPGHDAAMLADLRAKIEALHVFNVDSGVDPYRYVIEPLLRRADVLAIFDGGSDD